MKSQSVVAQDESPLAYRLAIETMSAVASTLTIGKKVVNFNVKAKTLSYSFFVLFYSAPALAIVDKAVVCNASGLHALMPSMIQSTKTLLTNPVLFMRQPAFLICWGVYSIIFTTANSIQALCERSHRSSLYPKLFITSAISINLNIAKDRAFARMFGVGEPRPLAYSSMACFGGRNAMTILAAFSLPGIISHELQQKTHMKKKRSDFMAQMIIPVTMQVFNTPLHLLGLDIYNRETATVAERTTFIKQQYFKTLLARIGHIFPAYGIGGVLNEHLRNTGRSYLVQHFPSPSAPGVINSPVAAAATEGETVVPRAPTSFIKTATTCDR